MPDKKTRLPALTLALITPVLTELLSGNIPAPTFFRPWVYASLIFVYGLPVLLIRELYISWKLSLPGLFLLGLAYGIFNEGVLAKTLLLSVHVPIDTFDHYTWLGVNFPWAALIVPWHAFHAVIFPIALVTWWFPAQARTAWLSQRDFRLSAILLIVLGILFHVVTPPHTWPFHLAFFAAVMAALIYFSKRITRSKHFLAAGGTGSLGPALAGFSFYPVFVLGLSICAGVKLPGFAICLLASALLVFYYRLLSRKGWLKLTPFVLFALGDYFAGALLTGLTQIAASPVALLTGLILAGLFAHRIWTILKSPHVHA